MLREIGWSKCSRGWLAKVESGEAAVRDKDLPFFRVLLGEEFMVQFEKLAQRESDERREGVLPRDVQLFKDYLPVIFLSFVML